MGVNKLSTLQESCNIINKKPFFIEHNGVRRMFSAISTCFIKIQIILLPHSVSTWAWLATNISYFGNNVVCSAEKKFLGYKTAVNFTSNKTC